MIKCLEFQKIKYKEEEGKENIPAAKTTKEGCITCSTNPPNLMQRVGQG